MRDNDDAIVGRILNRREALKAMVGAGLGVTALRFFGNSAIAGPATRPSLPLIASPAVTEGPFFVDEKLKRSDLIAGTDRKTVTSGLPLALAFTVYKMTGSTYAPMSDVQVDLWHADVAGVYSDEADPMNHEMTSSQKWLRGYQITDADGNVQFKTIFPGWYSGRAPHIHFKIRHLTKDGTATAAFTSQVFFREPDLARIYSTDPYKTRGQHDMHNMDDGIFAERLSDGTPAGSRLLLDLQAVADSKGFTAGFPVILTDSSFQSGGGRGGPRGGRGGRGGPGDGGDGRGFGPPPDDGFGGPPPGPPPQ